MVTTCYHCIVVVVKSFLRWFRRKPGVTGMVLVLNGQQRAKQCKQPKVLLRQSEGTYITARKAGAD